MITIKEYVKAESLEQAYQLNQKRGNLILGGMLWLKMGKRQVQTAIDLSGLGLDTIEETEESFVIGCMTTLRQLETHESLEAWCGGAIRESVRHIVGVQFRNCATLGGSLYGRFGFSDVLTCLLALDTQVELYHGGVIPLEQFAKMPYDRDILVRVIIRKTPRTVCYLSQRNTATDFPVLACAVSRGEDGWRVAIGARPARAEVRLASQLSAGEETEKLIALARDEFLYEGNMRGSAEYRRHLAGVLVRRCCETILG